MQLSVDDITFPRGQVNHLYLVQCISGDLSSSLKDVCVDVCLFSGSIQDKSLVNMLGTQFEYENLQPTQYGQNTVSCHV